MYPRNCSLCDAVFHTEAAFWQHYVQERHKDTRCMSEDEMRAFGFYFRSGAFETWGDRHREFWDADRFIWGALYKPAEVFGDMFPLQELPDYLLEPKRWKRLLHQALYGKMSGLLVAWKGKQ